MLKIAQPKQDLSLPGTRCFDRQNLHQRRELAAKAGTFQRSDKLLMLALRPGHQDLDVSHGSGVGSVEQVGCPLGQQLIRDRYSERLVVG